MVASPSRPRTARSAYSNQGYWLTNLQGGPTIKHRTTDPAPDELRPITTTISSCQEVAEPAGARQLPDRARRRSTTVPGARSTVRRRCDPGGRCRRQRDLAVDDERSLRSRVGPLPAGLPVDARLRDTGWDVFHINAIDREADGDYVVTCATWMACSASTTDVRRRPVDAREPPAVDAIAGARQLTIVGDPFGGPKRPHDARLNGNVLTMLDNQAGTGRPVAGGGVHDRRRSRHRNDAVGDPQQPGGRGNARQRSAGCRWLRPDQLGCRPAAVHRRAHTRRHSADGGRACRTAATRTER